ncbi:MAG: hypothetical protein H6861_03125 [Rhodospirillales bacterium]|nr:hypothetical protein [Rhodospirillales bacterium]
MCAFLAFGAHGFAFAQDALEEGASADAVVNMDPGDSMDDVPDEFIMEADAYFYECQSNKSLSQYHNCECLSLAYLDKRIEFGRFATKSEIMMAINKECRDAVGAAGQVYNECLAKAGRFKPGTDPEKYCECVANSYAKTINMAAPVISSRSMVRYQTYAYTACNNPDTRDQDLRFDQNP